MSACIERSSSAQPRRVAVGTRRSTSSWMIATVGRRRPVPSTISSESRPWREASHEAELAAAGEITADYRQS